MYMPGVLFDGKCMNCLTNVCIMHFTECPDLKPLSGRGCSTRRKAGDISPDHQESSHDTEASGRAGSKKRESFTYSYIQKYMHGVLYLGKCINAVLVNVTCTLQSVWT